MFLCGHFETGTSHDATYKNHPDVHLLHLAVWDKNGTLPWQNKYFALFNGRTSSDTRPSIDIADFIQRNVKPQDFLVVKIGIEGSEHRASCRTLYLINSKVAHLVDGVFVECHTERNSCCRPPNDKRQRPALGRCKEISPRPPHCRYLCACVELTQWGRELRLVLLWRIFADPEILLDFTRF